MYAHIRDNCNKQIVLDKDCKDEWIMRGPTPEANFIQGVNNRFMGFAMYVLRQAIGKRAAGMLLKYDKSEDEVAKYDKSEDEVAIWDSEKYTLSGKKFVNP